MNSITRGFSLIVTEVAELNRCLLLLQIEKLEDELLPCEEQLGKILQMQTMSGRLAQKVLLQAVVEKFARLRNLQHELNYTEQLLSVASN